jgi:uncharacterized protein YcfJ
LPAAFRRAILTAMLWRTSRPAKRPGIIEPCIPTRASKPPVGPHWVHEIKHDGYRLIARKRDDRVRLFTRRGYDWTDRYPLIRKAVAALQLGSAVIDGEVVCCDGAGVAVFEKLHSRAYDDSVGIAWRVASVANCKRLLTKNEWPATKSASSPSRTNIAKAASMGCLTGAVVGGVAGHYAHHTVTGAIAGCYMGHHIAREKQQQQLQVTLPSAQPRESGGWEKDDRGGGGGGMGGR